MGDRPVSSIPPDWMTVAQAAGYLGVSRATANRLVASRTWPSSVLPGMTHRRISPSDLAAIEAMAVPATSDQASA